MQSNIDHWNELQAAGKLYVYLKDGPPVSWWQQGLGFSYPLFLCCILIACFVFMRLLPAGRRKWKSYFFSVGCGTILGAAGCFLTYRAKGQFPGWLFPPWAVTGIEFGLTLEDWLFLPACTTLFYIFYRFIKIKNDTTSRNHPFHYSALCVYCALSIAVVLVTKTAGRLEIALYVVPGMALYWFARENIEIKKFFFLQIAILVFQASWDLVSVSLLHMIPGLSWASQWIYISFDQVGNYFHSPVFLDYKTHRWAWVLFNPVEMTPLFGICGGLLNCAMFATGDKLFYPLNTSRHAP